MAHFEEGIQGKARGPLVIDAIGAVSATTTYRGGIECSTELNLKNISMYLAVVPGGTDHTMTVRPFYRDADGNETNLCAAQSFTQAGTVKARTIVTFANLTVTRVPKDMSVWVTIVDSGSNISSTVPGVVAVNLNPAE